MFKVNDLVLINNLYLNFSEKMGKVVQIDEKTGNIKVKFKTSKGHIHSLAAWYSPVYLTLASYHSIEGLFYSVQK